MLIELDDVRAADAFDGPSTELERLRFRAGGLVCDLYEMGEGDPDVMIAKCGRLIALLRRIKAADGA
jgi:hypothetical protein